MMEKWMNIDAGISKELVQSNQRCLKAVVDTERYHTKYWFNEKLEYLLICREFL